MPKSKSKPNAPAASSGGLFAHPALAQPDPLLSYRMGSDEPLRLPDVENSPSAATVLRSEYTLGSDAAGVLVFAEGHALSNAKCTWTVTAGTTAAATTAVAHPQSTAFAAEARVARMIAMRIQVTYIGVEQEASGFISFSEKAAEADMLSQTVDGLHTGAQFQVRATDGLLVYVDYVQPPRYEAVSATLMATTFPFAVFAASGLPASKASLFRIRVSRFMEYLPVEGALAEGELRHEPHNPGALAAHGELSGPSTSVTTANAGPSFYAEVKKVASAAYHLAQPIMPYVAARARAYLVQNGIKGAGMLAGLAM